MLDTEKALFAPPPPVKDRSFGFAISGVLAVLGALPLLNGHAPHAGLLYLAAAIIALATIRPTLLRPFNRAFAWTGMLLQKIINPIIVTALFILVITPLALAKRAADSRRRRGPPPSTYWVHRDLAVTPAFFQQQF